MGVEIGANCILGSVEILENRLISNQQKCLRESHHFYRVVSEMGFRFGYTYF